MHFEALSTKYVNFNHFGWFFENFVTKFLFFWQFFLSFLVWEIILLSKNLSILGILHLSYTQREIKKSFFKQVQLASLQVELGKANSNKASFQQIDLNLCATLLVSLGILHIPKFGPLVLRFGTWIPGLGPWNAKLGSWIPRLVPGSLVWPLDP